MKKRNFKIVPVIFTVVVILLAMAAESVYLGDFEYRFRTRRFNRILEEKQNVMDECLNGMMPILAKGESHGSSSENRVFSLAEQNGITLLEYIGSRLAYWSDPDFDVPRTIVDSTYAKPLVFLQNGWFLAKSIKAGNEKIVALLRIQSTYSFENDIIKSGFAIDFKLPARVGFSLNKNESKYHIYLNDGSFLFSLLYPAAKGKTLFITIPLLLWGISFFLLLCLTLYLANYLAARNRQTTALISSVIIFSAVYLIILVARKPAILFQTDLFTPYRYTMNALIPSLGHLAVLSILLSLISYLFFRYLPGNGKFMKTKKPVFFRLAIILLPGAVLFTLYHLVYSHLIFNSNINFETFKVLDLDLFSLTAFICLALLFCVPFLYVLKVFRTYKQAEPKSVLLAVFTTLVVFAGFFYHDYLMLVAAALFYFLVTMGVWFLGNRNTGIFNKTVIFSVIFGFYSLFIITVYSEKKIEEKVKIQLVTYSTENDPSAEHLLLDMWPKISGDSTLRKLMNVKTFDKNDFDSISSYLHNQYFTGYWGNYNLNIVLCRKNDSLRIGDRNTVFEDCFSFFDWKVISYGHQLTGTGFYSIDNNQGRSNYLGRVFFKYSETRTNGLYLDLYNDINVFQPGYSELLLDKKYYSYARLRDYSFAKYINGEIALRTGDFPYNRTDAEYIENVNGLPVV